MQAQSEILLHKEILPFLNISMYLNDISFIRSIIVENTGETDSGNIVVRIFSDISCIEPFQYNIAFIPAGKEIRIPLNTLRIRRDFLSKLTESEKALIKIEVIENTSPLLSHEETITVHPLEYFGGFQMLPELIASYITPNHPYVYHIKRKAIEILEKQELKTAFEGYQSNNPERILQMMSAIYTALVNESIAYSSLPPGYEINGQRLRLQNTIQRERFGNCIDISLVFAACLEAIDLNPIIVITKGHAFTGCWLNDDKFAEIINDDKTAITKRLAKGIREMAVVEATSVCKGNNITYTSALHIAEAQLVEKEDFILSVDVRRARTARIRPLPLLTEIQDTRLNEEYFKNDTHHFVENKFEIGTIYHETELDRKQPTTKQKVWERKLLDLSLRNSLLNIRMTRNMLQLVDIDISHLEDTLADGKAFSILPNPRAEMLKKYNLFAQPLHHSSPLYQTASEELKYNRLLTYYHQQDLDNILSYIHKNAKQAIEENGSSTLYLAVGLLKWFDIKTPEQPRYAPVLLLPVEISRRSVKGKFTLKSREEETMINITLLEFLRQEYELNLSALEQLPVDDKGVDVSKVMGILRRAVMQLKGWDVEEQLVLGNFSFSKLILWKDIVDHQEELLKSSIVRSLVEGKLVDADYAQENGIMDFDSIHPSALTLPIPTDVSQLDAVLTAQQGKSFILHGPPGTGKSQTITNIIADALYRGKRVLFVAAKKAALDVVHKRLEQIGLAPFTLELHSNKSKKSGVLEQLARSLETAQKTGTLQFQEKAERLESHKREISNYAEALHQVQPVGWSLYDSVSVLEEYRDSGFTRTSIPANILERLDAAQWQKWEDWLPQFQSIIGLIEQPERNPLNPFTLSQFTPQIQDEIITLTQQLLQQLLLHRENAESIRKAIHLNFPINSHDSWNRFQKAIKTLADLLDTPFSLCLFLMEKNNQYVFEDWLKHVGQYQATLQLLLQEYNRSMLSSDLTHTEMQWKQAEQSWFLPRWLKKNKIRKLLAVYRKEKFETDEQIAQLFNNYNQLKETESTLQQARFTPVTTALEYLYKEEQTDLIFIRELIGQIKSAGNEIDAWENRAFSQWIQTCINHGLQHTDQITQPNKNLFNEFLLQAQQLQQLIEGYHEITGLNIQQISSDKDWLQTCIAQLENIYSHLPKLKDWVNYVIIRNKANEWQLQWLIAAFEKQLFKTGEATDYFYFTAHTCIAQKIIAQQESLSLFNSGLFEQKIEQYKKTAREFRELTKQKLRTKLSNQLPDITGEAMQSSETSILQRAIKNRGRGLSIRRLFDQIPTLLPRITPCMLMSPISVAQYFDVDVNHFDLVIFDEASQLPTCEAISALARARQAVIVGDPKQMPPTSFFSTIKLDEENMDVEDLESILDDCLALSMPSRYLLRHYRSRHESLIAFSNANYYENKLLTFPSADDLNRKVMYHPVAGFYDKGKTRQNKFEADTIVNYIKSHYEDHQRNKQSLGVITFSQTQQALIEDKLQQLFMSRTDLEQLANESAEPLFIKNLENVQGDERDIILFSVGYGPDEEGKMSMNFGPLNRNGGWRRLNVAITRARNEMHVFATLHADQIDLNRTSAEGVAGLKSFLHFAEKGHLAIRPEYVDTVAGHQSLSESICKKLEARGLTVRNHIGTSGFKIDTGIIHPHRPQQYILGIMLDGKFYYDAKTANDREMVMPAVLKALGWNIYRVWTMDWLERADDIIEAIIAEVERLKSQPEQVLLPEVETIDKETMEPASAHMDNISHDVPTTTGKQKSYVAHILLPVSSGTSETIYEFQNRKKIIAQIQAVVNTEAPISKNLLYKRVLQAWNTSRAGSRLDRHLENIIAEMNLKQTIHHQPFYWADDLDVVTFNQYRGNDIEKRSIEDIAPEELQTAIAETVQQNLSIEEEELLRYIARLFGFAKVGRQIDIMLRYAVDLAVKDGKIKRENGRVKV